MIILYIQAVRNVILHRKTQGEMKLPYLEDHPSQKVVSNPHLETVWPIWKGNNLT